MTSPRDNMPGMHAQPLAVFDSTPGASSNWRSSLALPRMILRCDGLNHAANLDGPAERIRSWADPLDALHWMSSSVDPKYPGRWAGFLSYDLVRLFERLPSRARDDLKLPLFVFTWHEHSDAPPVADRAGESGPVASAKLLHRTFGPDQYLAAVEKTIGYIRDGDIFQANLAQRFTIRSTAAPLDVYRRLIHAAPAPYAALLDYGDFALASNSPELFFRIAPNNDGSRGILTRPIKGTRPRRAGADQELARSPKDQAELNMIIDVERNDLGRICRIGSIRVSESRTIESHPTLYHGVAGIAGVLRPDVDFVEALRAVFPTGSVTGAPKIRAMEIIDEIEPVRRGPYCGAIGYLDSSGMVEFNVAIRTIIFAGGAAHVTVGGGIVADSRPADEYDETLVKAEAMFASLGLAECDASI